MDLMFWVAFVLVINLVVFLAGCVVAAYRTWGASAPAAQPERDPNGQGLR